MKITIYKDGENFLPSGLYRGVVTPPEKKYNHRLNGIGGCAHTSTNIAIKIGDEVYSGATWRSGDTADLEMEVVPSFPYEGEITIHNAFADEPFTLVRVGSQENPCGRFSSFEGAEMAQKNMISNMTGNWTSRFEIRKNGVVLKTTHRGDIE